MDEEAELGKILNQASREQILNCLHKLIKDHSPDLISNKNPCYLRMSISGENFNKDDVGNYMGSLPLVHCLDAWKYIGRAFQAVSRGDSPSACHLAYYAELRASISILASQGIAIFRDHYTIIKSDGNYGNHELIIKGDKKTGAHEIAWKLLGRLCYDTNFIDILPRIISIENYELKDFLQGLGYNTSSFVEFWTTSLSEWGIDLKYISEEQTRRNIASYLPNWFIRSQHSKFKELIKFSSNVWSILEYSNNNFINLDRALFKKTLEALKISRSWTEQEYLKNLDEFLEKQGIAENSSLYQYLHKDNTP